jgi:RNA recognition motif-containing protein
VGGNHSTQRRIIPLIIVTPPFPQMVSAKLIRDMDQKPKGFGYVEFKTLDGLKDALGRSGGQMLGRTVRTSVAEPRELKCGRMLGCEMKC